MQQCNWKKSNLYINILERFWNPLTCMFWLIMTENQIHSFMIDKLIILKLTQNLDFVFLLKNISNSLICRQSCSLWREETELLSTTMFCNSCKISSSWVYLSSNKLQFFLSPHLFKLHGWGNNKNAMVIDFLFQTCLTKTKATCMSHISLNPKKNSPGNIKKGMLKFSLHLHWLILSSVSSVLAWEHNPLQWGIQTSNIIPYWANDVKSIMGFGWTPQQLSGQIQCKHNEVCCQWVLVTYRTPCKTSWENYRHLQSVYCKT